MHHFHIDEEKKKKVVGTFANPPLHYLYELTITLLPSYNKRFRSDEVYIFKAHDEQPLCFL